MERFQASLRLLSDVADTQLRVNAMLEDKSSSTGVTDRQDQIGLANIRASCVYVCLGTRLQ